MSDLVTFGETALQFSPPGHERLETTRETTIYADGVESSAAVAATALGGTATWVSSLPDSPLGRHVVGQLREHGIAVDVTWADDAETRQGLVFREAGAPPRADAAWHDRDETAAAAANPGDLPMDLIQAAEAVFTGVSTPVLSEGAATTTAAMLRAADGSGVTTAAALDYHPGLRSPARYEDAVAALVDHLDVLIADADDLETVFDVSGQPREIAHTLAADVDIEMIVVTRSDQGAVALRDTPGTNMLHECDADAVETADAAGAHAAFAGGFIQSLVDGSDIAEALRLGVATAMLARSVPGPLLTTDRAEVDSVAESSVSDA